MIEIFVFIILGIIITIYAKNNKKINKHIDNAEIKLKTFTNIHNIKT